LIYEDPTFYSSFPSVIKRPNGELFVAFRKAPDRSIFGESKTNHVDPNSYLVMVRSKDGEKWTKDTELIYAHPFGGSQDPCMLQLRDGTILCASYGWAFVRPEGIPNLKKPYFQAADATFLGGYLVRSKDGGKSWSDAIYPPHIEPEINFTADGKPLPAYNRGALLEGKNGKIYWIVASSDTNAPNKKTSNHLIVSEDKGLTWKYSSVVAIDDKASFNESSIYETPKGDLVGFLRTAGMDDQACIARSTDGGKSFKWEKMGFQGHPLNALRLPDNRVLLTYGYRHKPFGIRARILNAECTDFATAEEFVLRDDGGSGDLGYTWPVQLDKNRVLVTYYFNKDGGTRHIAGTIVEIK
jgi:sialidase-1